ncbi:Chitin synthesis regulation, resistance to Congo red [Teratosphaeria destructans]|uniref:Chitin synthesis regulation, resistance to Congo red n=1 Tax=Teratosphaeria destructans TaxID=418781 RepID=A0A9W7SRP8_9PEZI|nr:Chitin synthesis regulation, resistance to Congo red [Teratosphaeria destructans]
MIGGTAHRLWKRQGGGLGQEPDLADYGYNGDVNGYYYPDDVSWWLTPAGMAVRYTIVAIIFAAIFLYFIGGYWHARRRARKGLAPLPYHRWMYRWQQPYDSETRWQTYQQPGQTYQMESYPMPPPAYNPAEAPPPVYQPPEGGSKVLADQSYVHVRPVEGPNNQPLPPPPPPAAGSTAGVR